MESDNHIDGTMRLDKTSIALLDQLKRKLPLLMPKKIKLSLIDKLCMHGEVVTRQRGGTSVSADDIMTGVH